MFNLFQVLPNCKPQKQNPHHLEGAARDAVSTQGVCKVLAG